MEQLEARVLKLEAASNKQSGMMKHKQPMADHDMGGPMGTVPQPVAPMPRQVVERADTCSEQFTCIYVLQSREFAGP